MEYFEIYKFTNNNWLDDADVTSMASMKWFTEMEEALIMKMKMSLLSLDFWS